MLCLLLFLSINRSDNFPLLFRLQNQEVFIYGIFLGYLFYDDHLNSLLFLSIERSDNFPLLFRLQNQEVFI